MADLINNVVALPISSRDRVDIGDSTTDFTIALKKSLRNIASLSVAGVVIPRSDTLIGPNNDTLTGAIIVDDSINLFSLSITRTNYTAASLATELQSKLNANTDMLSFGITFVVSYSTVTNRMSITATYPFGATHTWSIQIDFTGLRDIVGIGSAGTTSQTFTAIAGLTTLDIPCQRTPSLIRSLSYNITSSTMTNSVNTSYIASLGKLFNVASGNNTLTLESQLITAAHSTLIQPPADPNGPSGSAADEYRLGGFSLSITTTGLLMLAGTNQQGAFLFSRVDVASPWVLVGDGPIRDESYVYSGQGRFVAISGDGTTIASSAAGRVYVYIKSGSKYVEQTRITFAFGSANVNLNIDGSTLAISASLGSVANYVAIYHRSGSTWSLQQTLATPASSVSFGSAGVSLSNTGDNLVTGDASFGTVVAYVYLRTAGTWGLQQTIVPGDAIGGAILGVAMSGDGLYVGLSSQADNTNVGATWIYLFGGVTWAEQQKIIIASAKCALNIAGDTIIIGAPDTGAYINIWKRASTTWTSQLANYVGTGGVTFASRQGASVAITGAGDDVVWGDTSDEGKQGAVWTSHRQVATWTQVGLKVTSRLGTVIAGFGQIISISEDGTTMAAGFPDYPHNVNSGVVYIYVSNGLSWDVQAAITVDDFNVPHFGQRVSLSADGNTLISGGPSEPFSPELGMAWIHTRTGTTWTQKAILLYSGATEQATNVCMGSLGTTAVIANTGPNGVGINIWILVGSVWVSQVSNLASGFATKITHLDMNAAETSIIASCTSSGAVVFDLVSGAWTARANLLTIKSPAGAASFGKSCAMSADGLLVAVSDPVDTNGGIGATYVFRRTSLTAAFVQDARLVGTPNDGTPPAQGFALTFMASGMTLIISSDIYDGASSAGGGAIWIFDYDGASWIQRPGVIVGDASRFGHDVSAQKTGAKYVVGQYNVGGIGRVYEFSPSGTEYDVSTTIIVPNGAYSVFDIVNTLNGLMESVIADNNGYSVAFDGMSKLTLTSVIASPITSNSLRVATSSTFNIARWPSQEYKSSRVSNPMDFSINNDVIKAVVTHADNSDNVLVDNTPDILFRKFPAGFTIEAGVPIDIQLRNNRDQIIDLNGADWIMTLYATVRS